ncbi:unnamed protein product [Sphagnum jensenii]|uniref:Retrotransposon gag domain-containing protein n=1 Tax=Sphagnum jensenii TaxID=128206 RepID=A0ABP1B0L9_9BRYO
MAADVRNLNVDKLFKIAKLNLRGRARDWFRNLQSAPVDWLELRTLILQKYGQVDLDDVRMKLDGIKQEPKERVQRRMIPVEVTPAASGAVHGTTIEESGINRDESIRSKILSHFVKGKISLTPMETVMMIPGELEHLENLVKVAQKKKDAETVSTQVTILKV